MGDMHAHRVHVTHLYESRHTYECVAHLYKSRHTRIDESHVYVMPPHAWTSHVMYQQHNIRVTHWHESWHIYEWVPAHIWMSHGTHMNEWHIWTQRSCHASTAQRSCHTLAWVMANIRMSDTYELVTSHINSTGSRKVRCKWVTHSMDPWLIPWFIQQFIHSCKKRTPQKTSKSLQHTATQCYIRQHTATHSNTLQHTATHCNTQQHTATHSNTLQHTAIHCNTQQHTATHSNTLQHTATHCTAHIKSTSAKRARHKRRVTRCNTLQHTATHCNTLQHIATHCNILQHTATHCITLHHTATYT